MINKYKIYENWDHTGYFDLDDAWVYSYEDFIKITNQILKYYKLKALVSQSKRNSILILFDYYLRHGKLPTRRELPTKIQYLVGFIPKFIIKQYSFLEKNFHKMDFSHPREFVNKFIYTLLGVDDMHDLLENFDKLDHSDELIEKCLTYLVKSYPETFDVVRLLLKYKKLPNRTIKALSKLCDVINLTNASKYITPEFMEYAETRKELSFDYLLRQYTCEYDIIILKKYIKGMLLMFKTLEEDLNENNDENVGNNEYYQVPKTLIKSITQHNKFDDYIKSSDYY